MRRSEVIVMRKATATLQRWGNSLAVRIPAAIARSAQFTTGQPVTLSVEKSNVVIKAVGPQKLGLAQKLALFDPDRHGGEAMLTGRIGVEA